jgi:hypothetical protein
MKISLPLPNNQKLTVTYRIEIGCLGPEGASHIDAFCLFAEKGVAGLDADLIHWHIVPRNDKSLAKMQYSVSGKQLSHDKADKYLRLFGKNLDEFEDHVQGECVALIEQFFER